MNYALSRKTQIFVHFEELNSTNFSIFVESLSDKGAIYSF